MEAGRQGGREGGDGGTKTSGLRGQMRKQKIKGVINSA